MKFTCEHCQAKYQIPDEKIAGRTLRMKCRKCDHDIVIRGEGAHETARPASTRTSTSHVGPAPRSPGRPLPGASSGSGLVRAPSVGPGPVAGEARPKVQAPPALPPRPEPVESWHVAIHDVPVGPIKREELARRLGQGEITGDSLCWREGFDDWRPLREIPALASLLSMVRTPKSPLPGEPSRASVPSIGLRPVALPNEPDEDERSDDESEATVIAPSPLLAMEEERARRASAPSANPQPVVASSGPSHSTPATAASPKPAQVASIAPRSVPAPSLVASASATPAARIDASAEDVLEAFSEPPQTLVAPSDPPAPAIAPGDDDDDIPGLPPPVTLPPPKVVLEPALERAKPSAIAKTPAPLERAPLPDAPVAVVPSRTSLASEPSSPEVPARKGLPVGAWMGIAMMFGAGVTFAVLLVPRLFPDAPPPPAAAAEPVAPAPETRADLELQEDPEVAPMPVEAPTGTPTASPRGTGPSSPRAPTGRTASPTPTPSTPDRPMTAADREMLERFGAGGGASTSGVDVNAVQPTSAPRRPLSASDISAVVNRNRLALQRCYERAARGMTVPPSVRMDVTVRVSASGSVTNASVSGQGDFGGLGACIEATVRRWTFPPSTEGGETRFPFVFQGGG